MTSFTMTAIGRVGGGRETAGAGRRLGSRGMAISSAVQMAM